jgi:hypothetical protein
MKLNFCSFLIIVPFMNVFQVSYGQIATESRKEISNKKLDIVITYDAEWTIGDNISWGLWWRRFC